MPDLAVSVQDVELLEERLAIGVGDGRADGQLASEFV